MDNFLLNRNKKPEEYIVQTKEESKALLDEAKNVAANADVIVAVLGEPRAWSGEAASRSDISIPECQRDLLKEMLVTGKPVVLVLSNGRPLTLLWENENVDAIIEAWHGGVMAGAGLADVLFGDYNPAGKLTATFPRNVGQIPIYYNHKKTGRPIIEDFKFTSKYLDIPNTPLYPFGYGLSYTTFDYSELVLNQKEMKANGTIIAKVSLTNTGDFDGEEVVQLYLRDLVGSVSRPVKELKGFKKISLKKGESTQVHFEITEEDLKFFNSDLNFVSEPGDFEIYVGGNSRDVVTNVFKLLK